MEICPTLKVTEIIKQVKRHNLIVHIFVQDFDSRHSMPYPGLCHESYPKDA
jgi:hypothetical protein